MQAKKAYPTRLGFLCLNFRLYSILALSLTIFLNVCHSHATYGQTTTIIEIDDIQPRMANSEPVIEWEEETVSNRPYTHKPVVQTGWKWYMFIWEMLKNWWRMGVGG